MKEFRALAAQSPAILVSLVALCFSLGSGVAYAASLPNSQSSAAQAVRAITWTDLHLRDGLTGNVGDGGAAEFGVNGTGVIYLRGTIDSGCATRDVPDAATLPPGDHPAHVLYFPVATTSGQEGGFIGTAFVAPNGDIGFFKDSVCEPGVSLDGISFALGT